MNGIIDIDELEQQSERERAVRERIDAIIRLLETSANRGKRYPLSHEYRSHEIKKGMIEITMEVSCGGSEDIHVLTIPASLINVIDDDVIAWLGERDQQIKLRDAIDKKERSVAKNDREMNDLLAAFGHLNDPDWVHAKIEAINGLINDENREKESIVAELGDLKSKINPDFDMVQHDGSCDIDFTGSGNGKILFLEGSWRDVCSDVKKEDGERG